MKTDPSKVPVAEEVSESSHQNRIEPDMNKDEIKALIRDMLPSLLQDEEIKPSLICQPCN